MRRSTSFLALPLLCLPLALFAQRAKQDGRPPFTAYQEDEQKRLTEELPGVWTLTSAAFPGRTVDQTDVVGFAMFRDGFVSIVLQARAIEAGLLGSELAYYFQAGVSRYRVGKSLTLQLASVMGFDNMNDGGDLNFVGNRSVREHPLQIADGQLTLSSKTGARLVFRRVGESAFPSRAADFLERNPGGAAYDDR